MSESVSKALLLTGGSETFETSVFIGILYLLLFIIYHYLLYLFYELGEDLR